MTYEQMIERVEEITARIESGEVGLEQSISLYEEGVRLSRRCQDLLVNAQQRVDELNKQLLSGRTDPARADDAPSSLGQGSDLTDDDEEI